MFRNYNFVETTIGGEKYLYHSLTMTSSVPQHRDVIRANADKLHTVPYTHQIPDGSESACYELGDIHHGLVPLVHVFHPKRMMKVEELILFMHGLVVTLAAAKKLELYEDSFVLEPKYIYMKKNATQPQLIYLPMEVDMPLKVGFSSLVQHLSISADISNQLTAQIITALKNIAAGELSLHDVATIVVQAANNKEVDKKFLEPPAKKAPPKPTQQAEAIPQKTAAKQGFFSRLKNTMTGQKDEPYDDPFDSLDERTMISLTDASSIGLGNAMLYVMENDVKTLQIPITKDAFVLGRKREEVDFCFDGDDDKGISRVHASIIYDGTDYYLTDKGSSGGSFVNGNRVPPGQSLKINNGDIVQFYTKKMLFECS